MNTLKKIKNLYLVRVDLQAKSSCVISVYPNPSTNPLTLHIFRKNEERITYKVSNSKNEDILISDIDQDSKTEIIDLDRWNLFCDSFSLFVYVNGILTKKLLIDKIREITYLKRFSDGLEVNNFGMKKMSASCRV